MQLIPPVKKTIASRIVPTSKQLLQLDTQTDGSKCGRRWWPIARASLLIPCTLLSFAQPPIAFQPAAKYDFGSEIFQVSFAVADLNRDDRLDLIVTQVDGLAVFINRGDGTLPVPVRYSKPGGESGRVAVSDFNQDGWPDLALAIGNNLAVYLNHGDGTLGTPSTYPLLFPFGRGGSVCAADFNRDSFPDLLVVYPFNSNPALRIFRNLQDGTFVRAVSLDGFAAGHSGAGCADLNQDGFADFLAFESGLVTFTNLKNMTFARKHYPLTRPNGFILDDFTGDLYPDFLSTSIYLLNKGDGTFGDHQADRISGWPGPNDLSSGDLDLDGDIDLLSVSGTTTYVGTNKGAGFFGPPVALPLNEAPWYFSAVAALDLDDDGQLDIVAAGTPFATSLAHFYVYINNTHPSVRIRQPSLLPNRGGNNGAVTGSISMPGLTVGTTIKLSRPGQADIVGINPNLTSYYGTTILTATFRLTEAMPGTYDVLVVNSSGQTILNLADGFTVEQGGSSNVWTDVVGRAAVRGGREQTFYLTYGNKGTVDSPSTRIWLKLPSFVTFVAGDGYAPTGSGVIGEETYVAFDVPAVPASANGAIPFRLKAPDSPEFAHRIFLISVWPFQE